MRCSALPLASKCRGSHNLTQGHGSIHSRLGSAFHELAKAKVLNLADPIPQVKVRYALTDEEIEGLRYGLYNINVTVPPGAVLLADDKQLTGLGGRLKGTPDLAIFQPIEKALTVCDYKSGFGDVEPPETNNQLIGYAIMVIEELERQGYTVETVYLYILQPKLNQVKDATFTREQIMALGQEISKIIDEAERPDAEFTTGPWCNSCFKCFNCPAFAGQVRTLMSMTIDPGAPGTELVDMGTLLQRYLPFAKACGTIKNKIESLAKAWVDQHGDIDLGDGQRYARVIGNKKTVNPQKAFDLLEQWFSDEERWSVLSASMEKITDLCRKKMRGMSKTVSQELKDQGAIEENPTVSYRIVKTSDKESNDE